jgi:aspartyl-tRNA(Asn)/glutamyl-tRNA(Gln) amidotransferase subunit A
MEVHSLTIREAQQLLTERKVSAVELARGVLDHIRRTDPYLGAFVTIAEEHALRQAAAADERLRTGERVTPLTGIPYSVKDGICTRGVRTTCSSRLLANYFPPYSATVIQRLDEAGAVMVGKTNMDEFGMGSSCENSACCPTRNPWDLTRVPGGSSGGCGAAVAAGMGPFTLGEDTGGSTRMPASFCGVTGLKPGYGRVSRYGLIALASSFDSIGPMARDVHGCATVLQTIAGHDPHDSTSATAAVPDFTAKLGQGIAGMKLGVPKEYFVQGMEPGVEKAVREAIAQLEALGARTVPVSLPHTKYAIPVYYLILFAEASANLARYDGIRYGVARPAKPANVLETYFETRGEGFGPEVKRRIMMGTFVLSHGYYDAYYLQAQKVRTLLRRDFEKALDRCDVLVAPVCPTTAFKLGEKTDDPLEMYLSDILVTPVGLQIIGRPMAEDVVFQVGHAYQQATDWHTRRPPPVPAAAGVLERKF